METYEYKELRFASFHELRTYIFETENERYISRYEAKQYLI